MLSPVDFFTFVYYRINKITHNTLNNKAEVELIKAKDYIAFAPSSYSVSIVNDKWVNPIKFGGSGAQKMYSDSNNILYICKQ